MHVRSAIVIGGGLSGLTAAYRLQQAGRQVTVLERADRTGGCAATVSKNGYLADVGCNLINDSFEHYLSLAGELGVGDRVVSSSRVADFVRDGRPISVDPARKLRLAGNRLLSWPGKMAVATGSARLYPKLRTLDPYALTKVAGNEDRGTGTEFCRRYFNDEVGQYAIDPIVRSYAGTGLEHASGLSVLGALAVGLKVIKAVRGGMSALPHALESKLDVRLEVEALSIEDSGGRVSVTYRDADGDHEMTADECVVAVSFHVALRLWPAIGEAAPGLGDRLRDVGLISIALGYDQPSPTDAYAIMVPTTESSEVLCGFVEENKSPDRAPAGKTLMTLFTDAQVISGLGSAHRLSEAGADVVVLERSGEVGGLARTEQMGHYLVDIGANLINGSFTHYLGLAREVGVEKAIVSSSPAADILREGRAITVDRKRPLSPPRSPILSARGKASAAAGLARPYPTMRRIDPYAFTATADDYGTAREFCARYFDEEVTEWLIDPIVRAFAGTGIDGPSGLLVLSALAVGTKLAFGITGGMSALPDALARSVELRCGVEVTRVDETDDGVHVAFRGSSGSGAMDADLCVLAVTYHDARSMWPGLENVAGDFGVKLRDVPLMNISLGYEVASPTSSYAVLVPRRESSDALLVMMEQNEVPDRAPAGHTLVSLFTEAGATTRLMNRTDDDLMDWAAEFVESYYPTLRGRRDMSSVHRWPRTGYLPFPSYWQGIKEVCAGLPAGHVHTTSALFGSGGVERAVLGGERTARRIARPA